MKDADADQCKLTFIRSFLRYQSWNDKKEESLDHMENTNALSDMRYALGVWYFNEKLTNKANPCCFLYISSANQPTDSIAQANMYTVKHNLLLSYVTALNDYGKWHI